MTQWTNQVLHLSEKFVATNHSTAKVSSIGGYLNRLLSFSSAPSVSNEFENRRETQENNNNENSESFSEGYFFHDDILNNIFSHQDFTSTESKNSSKSLIRHQSFTSLNRGLESGRQ